ncbi:RES domain-containing protein [Gemmobacter aquatilis]|uniref:RES domain-containing protein n=1 Tax=Gemmobacter aquatilis TaxID=933059 RepID=A0A1H8NFI2_9RHOB|nr:RES domain-containing protein [Gemmobacter aquatilis]
MVRTTKRRDNRLIDAIEAIPPTPFSGAVWRVVREGRDPLDCSRSGGRWDDGTFDVLYTSLAREGALAEMHFHLKRGQPVFPSKVRYELHEVSLSMGAALKLLNLEDLARLGVASESYGRLSYQEKSAEYPRTQDIAEVAHFLEFDGLLVPSARWDCLNAVVFCERCLPEQREAIRSHGLIDWAGWEQNASGMRS